MFTFSVLIARFCFQSKTLLCQLKSYIFCPTTRIFLSKLYVFSQKRSFSVQMVCVRSNTFAVQIVLFHLKRLLFQCKTLLCLPWSKLCFCRPKCYSFSPNRTILVKTFSFSVQIVLFQSTLMSKFIITVSY